MLKWILAVEWDKYETTVYEFDTYEEAKAQFDGYGPDYVVDKVYIAQVSDVKGTKIAE